MPTARQRSVVEATLVGSRSGNVMPMRLRKSESKSILRMGHRGIRPDDLARPAANLVRGLQMKILPENFFTSVLSAPVDCQGQMGCTPLREFIAQSLQVFFKSTANDNALRRRVRSGRFFASVTVLRAMQHNNVKTRMMRFTQKGECSPTRAIAPNMCSSG
jgi:hypothetical protein